VILIVCSVLLSAQAAAAPTPTADGALHLLPPLNNGPTGDPSQADATLLDSVEVQYCTLTATGCTSVGEANSVIPGADLLLLTGTVYTTAFSGTLHGVRDGDRLRVAVRVGGLALGSTQLTADTLALLPTSTRFSPLVPLTVSFRIDRNPVVRTRYLHDHGSSATQVAIVLKSEFGLDDATAATVLYNDVRSGGVEGAALARAAATPAASPAASPVRTPYGLQDLVDAVSSSQSYGDNATRTAQVLVGKFDNQAIVNALAASPNLNANASQLLDAIQNGLGVTDLQQQVNLLAHATRADGTPLLSPVDVLAAAVAKNGQLTPVAALTLLEGAGYAAGPSIAALHTVEGTSAVDAAEGALQVFGFPIVDVTTALQNVYPGSDPSAVLKQAAPNLISKNCATYANPSQAATVAAILVRAGYVPADVAALLNSACAFSAPQSGRVLQAPAQQAPTYGLAAVPAVEALSTVYPVTGVAQALSALYFGSEPGPAQATDIGKTLAGGWKGPVPLSIVDLLKGVGAATQGVATPANTTECLSMIGAVSGGKSLIDGIRYLDNPELAGLLPNPFSSGTNGNLSKLGSCLIANGWKIPFPLKKVTVNEEKIQLSATSEPVPEGEVTTRTGWLPTISGPHLTPALNIASLPVFGSAVQDIQGGAYGCIQSICNQKHLLSDLAPFAQLKSANPFTMVVPALPGKVIVEGSYWTYPSFSCAKFTDPAAAAAAIALPFDAYTKIPGGTQTDGTNSFQTNLVAAKDKCTRLTYESGDLYGTVTVAGVGNVTDPLQATKLGATVVNLTGAENVQGKNYNILNTSALSGLSQIQTVAGNFLSLLGEGGVTPASGNALANLLQTGNG
jgi:hypothetical protein